MTTTEILVCNKCGSEQISEPYFINPNTSEILGKYETGNAYCDKCTGITKIVNQSEFFKENPVSLLQDWHTNYRSLHNAEMGHNEMYDLLDELMSKHPDQEEDYIWDFICERVQRID